jgi:flagellar M-ring protein FliF
MASSQKTEDVSGNVQASGVPGTASSLPRPTSRPGAGGLGISRRTENVTYQSSRVIRRMRLPQGTVKRISASVLVDYNLRWDGSGKAAKRVLEPLPPERVKIIHDLVAAAIGFDAQRGDQLLVESLPFESSRTVEPPEPVAPVQAPLTQVGLPAWLEKLVRDSKLALIAGSAAAMLLLFMTGSLWWMLRRRRKRTAAVVIQPALADGAHTALEAANAAARDAQDQLAAKLAEQEALKQRQEAEVLSSLKLPPVTTKKAQVLAKHLVETAKKDPTAAAQILRTWLAEGDRA